MSFSLTPLALKCQSFFFSLLISSLSFCVFFSLSLSFFLLHAAWWGIEGGFEVDYGLVFFSTWCNSIASNQWTLILVLSTASWCWVKMSDRWFVDTHIGEALYLCQGLISFLYLVCKCVYYADFMTLNYFSFLCWKLNCFACQREKKSLSVQYLSLVFKSGFYITFAKWNILQFFSSYLQN